MKKFLLILITVGSLTLLSSFTYRTIRANITSIQVMEMEPITTVPIDTPTIKIKIDTKTHNAFLEAIGHQESRNRYDIVNRYGYMGKYQFGKETLKTVKVSTEEFLDNPELQELAMMRLLTYNKKKLQKLINKYEGEVIHGVLVTESGLLAAAHLGGQGSVKKWFRTGNVRKDGNGIKITSYMVKFGGYKLNL